MPYWGGCQITGINADQIQSIFHELGGDTELTRNALPHLMCGYLLQKPLHSALQSEDLQVLQFFDRMSKLRSGQRLTFAAQNVFVQALQRSDRFRTLFDQSKMGRVGDVVYERMWQTLNRSVGLEE